MKTFLAVLLLAAMTCAAQDQTTKERQTDPNAAFAEAQKEPGPDFIPVQKQPVPVQNPWPVYPESARRAGLEGTAWVKVFVDEAGIARKAEVIKSDNEIFNQPSIDAAMQWKFEPALLSSGKKVAVWVTVPFKFRLAPKSGPGFPGGDAPRPDPLKKPMH